MLMIENYRTGNIWKWFMDNPEISQTMHAVGFKRTGWQIESADVDYLNQLAKETWDCMAYFVEEKTGLPYDSSERGEFTSASNIGLYLAALAAARDMGLISAEESLERAARVINSIEQFPTWNGFCQCWHSVKNLSPSPHDTWVSVVDTGNFVLGLRVAAQAFPELSKRIHALLDAMDWKSVYDKKINQLLGGYDMKNKRLNPDWHVDMLGTDSRAAVFAAVISGDLPGSVWNDLSREMEERYQVKYLKPGWVGGGLFMQYLTGIFVKERDTLVGRSAANLAYANMRNADVKKLPVWGWSSCADPDGGYIGWGKLRDEVVTPHASVLAIEDYPLEVVENLHGLQMMKARVPWTEGGKQYKFGFRDSINLISGKVADGYLALDQGMLFLSLANFLNDGLIRRYLSSDPAVQDAYAKIIELSVPEGGANVSICEPGYGKSLARSRLRRKLDVRRVKKPPVIDGNLSDWSSAATATIWHPEHTGSGIPPTGEEFQGVFRFMWDEEALYIAAEVADDEIVCEKRGPNLYEDDAVEIFIDPKNDGFIWGDKADVQIGISPTGPKGEPQKYAWFQHRVPKEVEVASRLYESVSPASYTIEVKIPWTSLGLVGTHPGAIIPLSFAVHTVNKSRDASAKLDWSFSDTADGIKLGEIRLVE